MGERLQKLIREKHHGELLIGTAEIVETDNLRVPFLIAAPAMRVPMILQDTVNPYLAARAVLLLVQYGTFARGIYEGERIADVVRTVAFPGLAAGVVGTVGPNTCAHQVRVAIEEVLLGKGAFPQTWDEASEWHQKLYTDRVRDLQF
jgi:O-acetyl-ADP-ribose deacetylase (regulator of RNase III)